MTSIMRARPGGPTSSVLPGHPAVFAWQEILTDIGLTVPSEAVFACTGGCPYVAPAAVLPFGGYEAAVGFGAALGFYCDDFRTSDPELALWALRAQIDLLRRRWRPLPVFGFLPQPVPGLAEPQVVPVVLRDLSPDTVRVTSLFADRVLGLGQYLSAHLPEYGYAALTPALRVVVAPARLDVTPYAVRGLRTSLRRQLTATTGVAGLLEFVAGNPTATETAAYRDHMWAAAGGAAGDPTFFRDDMVAALQVYGTELPDSVIAGFTRSAALHAEFLSYDATPSLLREIADTEHRALLAGARR